MRRTAERQAVYVNGTPKLSAPMGSIASEREFKIAKRVIQVRYNLKPENVQKLLLFLKYKYNLRMFLFILHCSIIIKNCCILLL